MTNYKKGYILAASLGSFIWGFWIEDMAYFSWRASRDIMPDLLGPESWVNWNLGGLYVSGFWVPTVYFLMSGIGFMLFSIAFIRGRKDFIVHKLSTRFKPKPTNRIREFLIYSASILPLIPVIWVICILAAIITSGTHVELALTRMHDSYSANTDLINLTSIVVISLLVYISTLMALVISDTIYEKFSYMISGT